MLNGFRRYIASLREEEFKIAEELKIRIENDFVEMRQMAVQGTGPKIGSDDLHHLLTFSRYLSLSVGKNNLTLETLEKAKSLEYERRKRLE